MAEKYLLKGKVAIVTGGAAGIGYAIAAEFAREGAKVVIAELRQDRGIQAAAEIARATGAEIKAICTDVRREDQIIHCVEETVRTFGRVDILINNASKIVMCPALEMTTETYEEIMRNNATSMVMFSR
ncbi:MAG: SDR family NAD(P)-dependent oxidoreductase, partial [Acidobacteriota bacterium]